MGVNPSVVVAMFGSAFCSSSARTTSTWPFSTPLYIAAQDGHVDAVRALLEQNADPNLARTDIGTTPLYIAARNGHVDAVRALLEHNADPNLATTDEYGATPLYIAAQNGHVDAVQALLEQNANPNTTTTDGAWTPLKMATGLGHTAVADLLRQHGATA